MADDGTHIKLLTIGDSGVGKSWLLLRWSGETNKLVKNSSMPTIGIDFKMKSIMLDGKKLKVQVWDTAGQERFRTITTSYYRNSQGILLVYDITDRNTFNNIRNWVAQINLHADVNINKILIGNKCDLIKQRSVTYEEGEALAREYNISFFETSAVNDINVDEAFMRIIKDVHTRLLSNPTPPGHPTSSASKPAAASNAAKTLTPATDTRARRSWC
eukprot:gene30364-36689_t